MRMVRGSRREPPYPYPSLAETLSGRHVLQQYERLRPVRYEALQLLQFAVVLPLVLHLMGMGECATRQVQVQSARGEVHRSTPRSSKEKSRVGLCSHAA
jgi:hypothetical protein